MSPISTVMHKVNRAKVHLDALNEFIKSWRESHLQGIHEHDDFERREYVVELRPPFSDLREGALIAGDFICCLRSSLDHLAWQLAATVTPEPSKRICFPIHGENTLDSQLLFTKSVFGIPDEAVAVIRSLQPYQGGSEYKFHFLWILHALWNIDKHRHIPLHASVTEYNFEFGTPQPLRTEKFDDHVKLFFAITDKPNVKLQPLKADIHFGSKQAGVLVKVEHLREIHEAVSNKVVPAFARFLP